MGVLIKDILDSASLSVLTKNFYPKMIRQENVLDAAIKLIKTIKLLELYPSLQSRVNQFEPFRENYPALYTHRTFFVWQFSQAGYQITSLNLSDNDFLESNSLKCQAVFMTVLLDDICDLGQDRLLFDKVILALTKGEITGIDGDVELCRFILDIWLNLQFAIEQTPNYSLVKPLLDQAYQDWITSFEYSLLIQDHSFHAKDNWEKHLEIIAHSTIIYWAALIDLLFVPHLLAHQAESASQVFLRTQKMAEIGNWVSTWERELAQRDFTSGIYAIALENDWITWDDLNYESLDDVKQKIQSSPVESYLWNEWERLRVESQQIVSEIQLPALNGYVESFSAIMFMQLASKGLM